MTLRPSSLPARAGVLGFVAAAGATLLILGALSDRLESDVGLGALNLALSAPLAVLATCLATLVGDATLRTLAGRSGWRPSPHLGMSALIIVGASVSMWTLAGHLSRPIRFDGWIALAGGVLLMVAGLGRHQSAPSGSAVGRARASRQPALTDGAREGLGPRPLPVRPAEGGAGRK